MAQRIIAITLVPKAAMIQNYLPMSLFDTGSVRAAFGKTTLVDPFYGIAFFEADGRWREFAFAVDDLFRQTENNPSLRDALFRSPGDVLDTGLNIGRAMLKDLLPTDARDAPFYDSAVIDDERNSLRAHRQECGLIGGSGLLVQNFPARYIALKLRLDEGLGPAKALSEEELFPGPEDDPMLAALLDSERLRQERLFPIYGRF